MLELPVNEIPTQRREQKKKKKKRRRLIEERNLHAGTPKTLRQEYT
jgi:hypothetical protein